MGLTPKSCYCLLSGQFGKLAKANNKKVYLAKTICAIK